MKAWEIGPKSGIGGLRLGERDPLTPGPGEVLVDVLAAGLNYRDLMVLGGNYGNNLPETRVPTADGVGRIAALGEGVTGWSPGQRVIAPHFVGWLDGAYSMAVFGRDLGVSLDGWLAEQIVLPTSALVAVPDSITDASAATLSVACSTVWHAMVDFGQAGPGSLVLTQGTGGMAIFALQLAKAMGAQVAITSSSDEKLAKCRELGADFTVNYRTRPDWAAALLEATGGRGADVVVDTLGFPALAETVAACAVNARIGTLGALSGTPQAGVSVSQGLLIAKNIAIKGIASGSRAMLSEALDVFAGAGQQMVVDQTFAFADAPAAFAHLASGAHLGKVVVGVA
jgi:NADPH:quinone reductase-like Zn-dependent oxidoreductase